MRDMTEVLMTDMWLTLNEHRSKIDRQVLENQGKTSAETDQLLDALYLSVRLIPNTKHSGVSKTQYKPMSSVEGAVFPDTTRFEETTWVLIEKAATNEIDYRLRAHLADLIWCFRGKYSHARLSLDAFQATYKNLDLENADASHRVDYLIAIFRSLEQSREVNASDDHKSIANDLIEVMARITSVGKITLSGWNLDLFRMALCRFDHFSAEEKAIIYQMAQSLRRKGIGNEFLLLDALEICKTMARSLGMHSDATAIVADTVDFWLSAEGKDDQSALGEAERIKNAVLLIRSLPSGHEMKSMLGELESRRRKLHSDDANFSTFEQEFQFETRFLDRFLVDTDLPAGKEPLALSVFLLANSPTRASSRKQLEEHKAAAPFYHLITHSPIEADGLTETILASDDEKDGYFITQNVESYMRIMSGYLVALSHRDEVGFTSEALLQLISSSDLLNMERKETIEASINAYFDGKYFLCVSLLAMEFEPAVKHIFSKLRWNFVASEPSGAQYEVQLDDLLTDARLAEVLDDRWIFVAQAILTAKGGQKVRHKVAHGRRISHLANREFATLMLGLFLYFCNLRIVR